MPSIEIRAVSRFPSPDGSLVLLFAAPSSAGLPASLRSAVRAAKDFKGEAFAVRERILPNGGAVLFYGTGGARDEGTARLRGAVSALRAARRLGLSRLLIRVPGDAAVEAIVRGLRLAGAKTDRRGRRSRRGKGEKIRVELVGAKAWEAPRAADLRAAEAAAEGAVFAREITDLPPNEKPPTALARRVAARFRGTGVRIRIRNAAQLRRGGYGGILAVGQGSANPPVMLEAEYRPARARASLVLVGKGVTFDAGGLSIKSYDNMKTMKCDCAGAGAVLGAILAIARLRIPVRTVAIVGFVENMLGGGAMKPGDIARTRSGKTIEILNTDAEGRIVLADLLSDAAVLAKRIGAAGTIDCATLTGACVVALGEERAGLFSNDEAWGERIGAAAARAGEWLWPLPLGPEFHDAMKSKIADLKNTGSRWGGASSAAAFLAAWAPTPWAHIDIAGPAFSERESGGRIPGGTGFGVATLVEAARGLAKA